MDKLRMQTANKADENFRKLAAMFPQRRDGNDQRKRRGRPGNRQGCADAGDCLHRGGRQ